VIPKPLASIDTPDLEALVSAPRLEDRQIDYKLDLPGTSDDDKREFLADVVAFANAAGGDIVFGVEEQNGAPVAVRGVGVTNFDDLRLRLQNLIREATDPRLPSIDITAVGAYERGPVVVLRVHQSWQAPHMVSYKRWSRFFMRDAGQRHQMDAQELKTAFVAGEATAQRIRTFREARVAAIAGGDTPVKLFPHACGIIHILPVGPAFNMTSLDLRVAQPHVTKLMSLDFIYAGSVFFNLDGLLVYSGNPRDVATDAYIQIFRNGGVEAVSNFSATEKEPDAIYGSQYEKALVQFTKAVADFRHAVGLDSPVVVGFALAGVGGLPMLASRPDLSRRFDRDVIVLPEVVLTEFDDVPKQLRVAFDTMWQAAGWSGSPHYNADGSWSPPK
jgi:hypothetical protein